MQRSREQFLIKEFQNLADFRKYNMCTHVGISSVGQYQYFISSIQYYKVKMILFHSILIKHTNVDLIVDILLTMCLVSKQVVQHVIHGILTCYNSTVT